MTRVGPQPLRLLVQPQEVFVARGAAHPGLPEPHRPREEELALTGLHPTLPRHFDVARPSPRPHTPGDEDLGLLPVEVADVHRDGRLLLLLRHLLYASSSHWGKHRARPDLWAGDERIDTDNGKFRDSPGLTEVFGADR